MQRWQGQIAVVTGASAGIGAAIAEKLVEHGLQVVGLARRKEKLEELETRLADRQGKFISYKLDMSNKDDILETFNWIAENVGPISILVNNAGMLTSGSIIKGDIDVWKHTIDVNIFGLTVATREALKSMDENQIDGHVVNINSVTGHEIIGMPNLNVYPATKHAVTGFTSSLRKELAMKKSKIRVTSVSPGVVNTEAFKVGGFFEDPGFSEIYNDVPKLLSEDIANAVLYILGAPPHVQITELTIRPTGEVV